MNKIVLQTDGLTRWFGSKRAVDDVCLQVEPGTVVGLVGPNGAGKTTFLHLVAGLLEPSAGTAEIDGHDARRLPGPIAAGVICVGDRNEPDSWCRLSDLIGLHRDASSQFDMRLARQLLEERELSERQRWKSLSKGQRRWALCALALASRPRLLLLDEPADGLDPLARRSLYDHIRDYVSTGESTAIVSSHILHDLQRAVDQLVVLKDGHVVLNETLDTLRDEVREIEVPATLDALPLDDDLHVLSRVSEGDFERLWVRATIETALQQLELRADIVIRTVNLESLYLAIAGQEGREDSQTHTLGETPCS